MVISYAGDAAFASYLFGQIPGPIASAAGWADGTATPIVEAVRDALLVMGWAGVTTASTDRDVQKLRAVGRVMLWRALIQFLITQYDVTTDGSTFKRSQQLQQLEKLLLWAENEATSLGVNIPAMQSVVMPPAEVSRVPRRDPYTNDTSIYGI